MSRATSRRAIPWLVLVAVLLAALSMRGPIIALTPVLPVIISDLGITATAGGMLTTAPVIMFAALTAVAALVIRRAGAELALLFSLSGVILGTLVRALPGYPAMLIGMLLIGAAITIGNIVVPVIIRRDLPPEHTATATAAYTAMMNVGSLVTALGTAPLSELIGWSPALLVWVLFAVFALVLWIVHIVRARRTAFEENPTVVLRGGENDVSITGPLPVMHDSRVKSILRRPVVWMLLVAFATQSVSYYALTTWLPSILIDTTGASLVHAGALSSIFQGVGILGAFLAPVLLRYAGSITSAAIVSACWLAMVIGIVLAPDQFVMWAVVGAIAQSSGYVIIFTAVVRISRSDAEAATISAVVQGGGYLLSATGAPIMGALHEATGAWVLPLWIFVGVLAVYAVALVSAMVSTSSRR